MDVGEHWGYRSRGTDHLVEVELLRIGDKRPARVQVRFLDESMEDRREWVPPGRLKVPWESRHPFIENEKRWEAIHALGVESDSAADFAADTVIRLMVPRAIAEYEMSGYGRVYDTSGLAAIAGLDVDTLTKHPASFVLESGAWVLPWPAVEPIVKCIARDHANRILQYVEGEERDFDSKAAHGYHYVSSLTGEEAFMDPEDIASSEMEEYHRPTWNLLREWCGEDTVTLRDELNALRVEIRRVGDIAERAIDVLRLHGFARQAESLSNDLGLPVAKGAGR